MASAKPPKSDPSHRKPLTAYFYRCLKFEKDRLINKNFTSFCTEVFNFVFLKLHRLSRSVSSDCKMRGVSVRVDASGSADAERNRGDNRFDVRGDESFTLYPPPPVSADGPTDTGETPSDAAAGCDGERHGMFPIHPRR